MPDAAVARSQVCGKCQGHLIFYPKEMLAHFTGFSISTDVGSCPMTDGQSRQSLEVASYPFGLWPYSFAISLILMSDFPSHFLRCKDCYTFCN